MNKPISNTFHVPAGQTYANCVNAVVSCDQGIDNQKINSVLARVTWQVSPRNKLSVYADKLWKSRGSAMGPGDDPDTASVVWTSPLYLTNTIKWTSTVSSKLLIEGGYSSNIERTRTSTSLALPSREVRPPGSPEPPTETSDSRPRAMPLRLPRVAGNIRNRRIDTTCRGPHRM